MSQCSMHFITNVSKQQGSMTGSLRVRVTKFSKFKGEKTYLNIKVASVKKVINWDALL